MARGNFLASQNSIEETGTLIGYTHIHSVGGDWEFKGGGRGFLHLDGEGEYTFCPPETLLSLSYFLVFNKPGFDGRLSE